MRGCEKIPVARSSPGNYASSVEKKTDPGEKKYALKNDEYQSICSIAPISCKKVLKTSVSFFGGVFRESRAENSVFGNGEENLFADRSGHSPPPPSPPPDIKVLTAEISADKR